jgi:pimeloyl-ACP methyl ester carboxylesterase
LSGEQRQVRTDDGATLAYTALGTGTCNLLFLHGWGGAGSGSSWAEVLKHLDLTGLRALVVDLRGHGKSEQTATGFTTERFARDALAVADDAGAHQFISVAYSMSGKWSQWLACSSPERLIGQVLLSPAPATDLPIPDEEKERWLAVARSGDKEVFAEWARAWSKEPLPLDVMDGYFSDVTHTSQITLSATLDMCIRGGTFLDRLPTIRAATLVVAGKHDPLFSPDFLRDTIVARIPGARIALMDCGHEIPFERPNATAVLLQAFLAGLRL